MINENHEAVKKNTELIKKYTKVYSKHFMEWRNEFRDIIRDKIGYEAKSKSFITKAIEDYTPYELIRIINSALNLTIPQANLNTKEIMQKYAKEINTEVVKRLIAEMDLYYYGEDDYINKTTVDASQSTTETVSQSIIQSGIDFVFKLKLATTTLEALEYTKDYLSNIDNMFQQARNRSDVISTTQSNMHLNDSLDTQYKYNNIEFGRWIAILDDRTRPTHAAQDGLVRRLGDTFPNGLRYPSDSRGPIEEVINCRCTLIGVSYQELTQTDKAELGIE